MHNDLNAQGVANTLNALSRWPDNAFCVAAVIALAGRLAADPGLREDLDPSHATQALNALSKWPGNTVCEAAVSALAERLAADPGL
ncbi:hypothetical protein, partial [Xanthomonas phaseoli]|uniref:hypothetical protein n=1 Tax=Xanthomonas phaseoli TaxID=1985254 RepID=UPI003CCFDE34